MKIYLLICLICVVKSETTCGYLKIHYSFNKTTNSYDGQIRLYPNADIEYSIKVQKQYRWMYINTTSHVILQKNVESAFNYDRNKYAENDFTLSIWQLTRADEGTYKVECWAGPQNYYYTSPVELIIPETATSVTTNAPIPSTSPGMANTTVIVVAVCAVVTVFIISATIFLIRQKRHYSHECRSLIRQSGEHRSTVNFDRQNDSESVYNEIDIEVTLDYAKVAEYSSANHSVVKFEHSPTLPDRPSENKEGLSTDGYDKVSDVEYSEISHAIISDSGEVTRQDTAITGSDEYELTKPVCLQESLDNSEISAPEYAKVIKQGTQQSKNHFRIAFPSIDCAKLTMSLGDLHQEPELHVKEENGHAYSNLGSKSIKRKSEERRASRRDLQYAILDLSDPQTDTGVVGETLASCKYADIDFEKKAFVAPRRKPPSSWYKRRNQRTTS